MTKETDKIMFETTMYQLFEKYKMLWLALLGLVICVIVIAILVGINWTLIFLKRL